MSLLNRVTAAVSCWLDPLQIAAAITSAMSPLLVNWLVHKRQFPVCPICQEYQTAMLDDGPAEYVNVDLDSSHLP